MGGAEALDVKTNLDHSQKEPLGGAAHSPSAPVIPLSSDPNAVTAVLSLPSHPPTPKNLIWLVPSQQIPVDVLSREGKDIQGEENASSSFCA